MDRLLRRCSSCARYTMSRKCSKCGKETITPHPPKFSPDDKYVLYRNRDRYRDS